MRSSLQATVLAATAALAIALGAAAAHAGDFEDLVAAQEAASMLDAATGGDDMVSQAVEGAAADAASEALLGAVADAVEE
jgi:hypothetical protein